MKSSKSTDLNRSLGSLEYLTWEQAQYSCRQDADRMVVDDKAKAKYGLKATPESYTKANTFGYYALVNVWLNLIVDKMPNGRAKSLPQALVRALSKGISLIDIINDASATADAIIRGDELPPNVFSTAYTDGWTSVAGTREAHGVYDYIRDALTVLRFPKRFSPLECDALLVNGLEKFRDCERFNSRKNVRNERYSPIIARATQIVTEIFRGKKVKLDYGAFSNGSCNYTNYSYPKGSLVVNPGRASYTSKSRAEKWLAAVGDPGIIPWEYTCTLPSIREPWVSRIRAVPKSYKSVRIIAMENPELGFHAYALREWMVKTLSKSRHGFAITVDDQSNNRYLANVGSTDGSLATLDLSSASDSIPYSLCATLFQYVPHVWDELNKCRARYLTGVQDLRYKWRLKGFEDRQWSRNPHMVWDAKTKCYMHKEIGSPEYGGPNKVTDIPLDQAFNPLLQKGMATCVSFPEGFVPTQMMFTSGSQLTPITESITFYALTRAACEYASLWTNRSITDWKGLISVYNDDIVCPSWAAETVIDALENCGFTVNHEKSFYNQDGVCFRESCGGDYYGGYNLTSLYWPRKEISISPDRLPESIVSLVDLNHRLFYGCPTAARAVEALVLGVMPSMTTSHPAQGCQDLWSDYAVPVCKPAPTKAGFEALVTREIHLAPTTSWKVSAALGDILKVGNEHDALRLQLEMIQYMLFLKEGPYFENPLDELLGVSTPRPSLRELCAQPCVKWRKTLV